MIEQCVSTTMVNYRFFAVNCANDVLSFREVQCAGDAEAMAAAGLLTTDTYGVEVWDVERRVARLGAF